MLIVFYILDLVTVAVAYWKFKSIEKQEAKGGPKWGKVHANQVSILSTLSFLSYQSYLILSILSSRCPRSRMNGPRKLESFFCKFCWHHNGHEITSTPSVLTPSVLTPLLLVHLVQFSVLIFCMILFCVIEYFWQLKKDQMLCFTLKVLLLICKKTFSAFVQRFLKDNVPTFRRLQSKRIYFLLKNL